MSAATIEPPLMTQSGFTPKKAGVHSTRSASLPFSTEPMCLETPWGDGGVDGVFGDIALGARVVVASRFAGQGAALAFHLVGRLPGADDDLAHPAHRLAVARN